MTSDEDNLPAATADLIHDIFRLNALLVLNGDRMFAELGLTSARMQVFGAIALADPPRPVAWLARDLGTNRQGVQRIVNDLVAMGFVALAPNPHHRRAHLVTITEAGRAAHQAATALRRPGLQRMAETLSLPDIETTRRVIALMRAQLEQENPDDLKEQD